VYLSKILIGRQLNKIFYHTSSSMEIPKNLNFLDSDIIISLRVALWFITILKSNNKNYYLLIKFSISGAEIFL
jgi:hypothetical protein